MLGLQVAAPVDGKLERLAARPQDFDRLGIGEADEFVFGDVVQVGEHGRLDPLVKKRDVFGAFFEHVADDRADEFLGEPHVVGQSKNGISGSIIQNSARWRGVLEFSARKVGPNV